MPEGLEWWNELPDEWELPDELLEPARSPERNLAIKMLACDVLGLDVGVLVGRFVTEQSLFTIWFLREVKGSPGRGEKAAILSGLSLDWTRQVYEAWKRFEESTKSEGPNDEVRSLVLESRASLARVLKKSVEALGEIMAAS
jgi:hypothetical protein